MSKKTFSVAKSEEEEKGNGEGEKAQGGERELSWKSGDLPEP